MYDLGRVHSLCDMVLSYLRNDLSCQFRKCPTPKGYLCKKGQPFLLFNYLVLIIYLHILLVKSFFIFSEIKINQISFSKSPKTLILRTLQHLKTSYIIYYIIYYITYYIIYYIIYDIRYDMLYYIRYYIIYYITYYIRYDIIYQKEFFVDLSYIISYNISYISCV